jgi:uncharacterized protein YkwD
MANMKHKKSSKHRPKLVLGFILSLVFIIIYFSVSFLYVSNNTDTLSTVFNEKSQYIPPDSYPDQDLEPEFLTLNKALSVLSLTEDQLLYDMGSQVSDSIESAGLEINHKIKQEMLKEEKANKEEEKPKEESSSPPLQETAPPGTNSTEAALIHMINHIRSSRGLQTLLPNPILNNIARSRCQDMLKRGYFSHYTPEGKNIGIILQENGIMYACSAENLGQANPPSWGSPSTIINLWMGSSSHRANLLNPHFGQLGIGVVDGGGRRVVVLVLINR